ncbi:11144_t:CDS:2 [Ambispora leptoticha]|uniref:Glucosamine 6-phosphate N-acetyltransferase n=1 Tax=Ambispora leptoticha TaxID=144679 RepID=A0A9N9E9A3_9GLOM|nr:11144_t:CDS:2 [Ambispora leptoticha]
MTDYLFEKSLISDEVQNALPLNYAIRPLAKEDYDKGVLDCLGQLSIIEEISETKFSEHFAAMKKSGQYYIVVIEDKDSNRVVGLGTLLVELKFLRGCSKAGHIEDIVVDDSYRGKKFGLM